MRILSGLFDPKNNYFEDYSENIIHEEHGNYSVSVCGSINIENQKNNTSMIADYYQKYGNQITEHIRGLYIVVIYDKINHSLAIFQDRTTSPITLYYAVKDGMLYYSTSLKWLLLNSKIKRTMNESVVEEFILNGFIYGEQTLLENIFKIKSFHCLNVDESGATQNPVSYCYKNYTESEAHSRFKEVLDQAILNQAKGLKEINAPLSSGYDSSYIVDTLSKKTDLPINAFSIGGKFGKNELPIVEKNVKEFPRTTLFSKLTDSETLQNYPDIVWRLEGNVYENGLFLQYELNKLVHESGKKDLICGECADQVLNQYYFNEERNAVPAKGSAPVYYEFSEYPYIFSSYLIYKKNGIMANSFDIQTKYPYLDNEFVALCKPLGEYNGKTKRKHKENCNECLPEGIIDNISKIGGATECHSLFNSSQEIERFCKFVERSTFFKSHKSLIKKHSYAEKVKPSAYIRLKTKVRNTAYGMLNKERNKSDDYFNEEMKLREYLNYTYLILFDELFVSGKYDKDFSKTGINCALRDLV